MAMYIKDYLKNNQINFHAINEKFGLDESRIMEHEKEKAGETLVKQNQENHLEHEILNSLLLPDEDVTLLLKDKINIQIKLITHDLRNVNAFYKDFSDYRLWLSLAQQKMNIKKDGSGDYEAAIDYIRNGIRQIPLNFSLLYNFGIVNEKLGNFNIALKFLRFAQ